MAFPRPAAAFLLIILFASEIAFAETKIPPEIRFGPEFTFSNIEVLLGNNGVKRWAERDRAALAKYGRWLEDWCEIHKDCIVEASYLDPARTLATDVEVLMENGFRFKASTDANVIEFSTTPLSVGEWDAQREKIQRLIFDGMESVGLKPQNRFGSGHINIDKEAAFGGDVLRFRDFVVDFFNHPGLSDGIMEKDPFNARGLALLGDFERENFSKIVARVDRGEIKTIQEFETEIQKKVFRGGSFYKGYALRFHKNRIEIRAARAQSSVAEFIDYARIFEGRIKYLAILRAGGFPVQAIKNVGANYAWQSASQFFYYLKGAGVDWESVGKKLMPSKYKIYSGALPIEVAYAERVPCVYWMKGVRGWAYDRVADTMGGIGK